MASFPWWLFPALLLAALFAVGSIWGLRAARRAAEVCRELGESGETRSEEPPPLHFVGFDEPPLEAVERAFERLVADGRIRLAGSGVTSADVLPPGAGPVLRALLARTRSVELTEVQIIIHLAELAPQPDVIGGRRFRAEPEEIDLRLASVDGAVPNITGDVVLDATWSPRGSGEIPWHSTILHFLVRAVAGDRA